MTFSDSAVQTSSTTCTGLEVEDATDLQPVPYKTTRARGKVTPWVTGSGAPGYAPAYSLYCMYEGLPPAGPRLNFL